MLAQIAGRDARGARGSARPGPRHLPAAARGQGPGRGARGASAQVAGAGRRSTPRASGATRRTSRPPSTSVPRGAAERGEVRRRERGRRSRARAGRAHLRSRCPTTARLRSDREPATAPACRGSPTGWARSRDGSTSRRHPDVAPRSRDRSPRSRSRRCPRERPRRRSDPRRSRRASVGSSDGWSGWRWA